MDNPVGLSYLATPIMSNVRFTAPDPNYILPGFDFEGNENIELNDVLVSVNQPKNIVKTQLVRPQGYTDNPQQQVSLQRNWGYMGTVKEYISMGDYQIRLQGLLVGEEIDVFPFEKLERLKQYLSYPGSFMVSGKFIGVWGDEFNQVVVNDYNISEQRGFSNQLPFTIQLLSDDYLEVKYEPSKGSVESIDILPDDINTA